MEDVAMIKLTELTECMNSLNQQNKTEKFQLKLENQQLKTTIRSLKSQLIKQNSSFRQPNSHQNYPAAITTAVTVEVNNSSSLKAKQQKSKKKHSNSEKIESLIKKDKERVDIEKSSNVVSAASAVSYRRLNEGHGLAATTDKLVTSRRSKRVSRMPTKASADVYVPSSKFLKVRNANNNSSLQTEKKNSARALVNRNTIVYSEDFDSSEDEETQLQQNEPKRFIASAAGICQTFRSSAATATSRTKRHFVCAEESVDNDNAKRQPKK